MADIITQPGVSAATGTIRSFLASSLLFSSHVPILALSTHVGCMCLLAAAWGRVVRAGGAGYLINTASKAECNVEYKQVELTRQDVAGKVQHALYTKRPIRADEDLFVCYNIHGPNAIRTTPPRDRSVTGYGYDCALSPAFLLPSFTRSPPPLS